MSQEQSSHRDNQYFQCSRRGFIGGAAGLAAAPLFGVAGLADDAVKPATPQRKIKVGLVGCGGRGSWIANLFKQHGGYEYLAVADYFQESAEKCGKALGLDKSRCFSGLSGYKKVIESGIEAIILEVPAGFFPEQAAAAVAAGLHVYMAKPVAVDVPGCMQIEAAGKQATKDKRVFFVDYQITTEPSNIQVAERIWKGDLGKICKISTVGVGGYHEDAAKNAPPESLLQRHFWDNYIALGGSIINTYDIHAIDAARWITRQRPVVACGASRICRPAEPISDAHNVCSVVYEYADGLIHEHSGMALPNGHRLVLDCHIYGVGANATVSYYDHAVFQIRRKKAFSQPVVGLYAAGAKRNIASFHQDVLAGRVDNPTVPEAVDSCLTCILGREAASRRVRLTMEELLKENKKIELDLRGLKS